MFNGKHPQNQSPTNKHTKYSITFDAAVSGAEKTECADPVVE